MTATFLSQPRLDSLVTEAVSGRAVRRTEYSGVLWVDGPITFDRWFTVTATVHYRNPRVTRALVPDSLVYLDDAATVVVTTSILGPGQLVVMAASAELTPSPVQPGQFVLGFSLTHAGSAPASFGYRIVVESLPEHVE